MDPVTAMMQQFREDFAEFRDNPNTRLLRIVTNASNVGTLGKLLRREEWDLGNQRPFLVFHTAYTNEHDSFEAMCRTIAQHYEALKKGLGQSGTQISDFGLSLPNKCQLGVFTNYVRRFVDRTAEVLDPPYVCWLPTDVQDEGGFISAVVNLVNCDLNGSCRFILTDSPDKETLWKALEFLNGAMTSFSFSVDEQALQEHFRKLILSPPSKGRARGTLPGSAAPDVEPPPRPGPPPPTESQIAAAAKELGLPPMLNPEQGERLRRLIMEAAVASGEKNEEKTLAAQKAAIALCAEAGVKLEQSLMTMLLATYLLQFQREQEAIEQYELADKLAGDAKAYPQMAQMRLAIGYLYLKNQQLDEAAQLYEQAAAAAVIGESNLLYWEALRMAGTCHLQAGRKRQAYLCWDAAVHRAEQASPDEIRNSGFLQIASALIKLLNDNGHSEHARAVEALVTKAGAPSSQD